MRTDHPTVSAITHGPAGVAVVSVPTPVAASYPERGAP